MYKPTFNTVLVEIVVDKWAPGNDDSMLGKSYREGRVIEIASELYPAGNAEQLNEMAIQEIAPFINGLVGKDIMWNEGVEAGTTFEDDGKLYGFIYWWDVRGVKE